MDYKKFNPGEVFAAADANNLLSGGMIAVDTFAQLDALRPDSRYQQAIVAETGRRYLYMGTYWRPDTPDIQVGAATISGDGTTGMTAEVLFDRRFLTTPTVVVASVRATSSVMIVMEAKAITTRGFTLYAVGSSTWSSTYSPQFVAVGA